MITFRPHRGGGHRQADQQFPDLAAMLADEWVDGWKSDEPFNQLFIEFAQTPYVDGWNLLLATYRPTKYLAGRAVVGYFKADQPVDLPAYLAPP